MLPLWCLKYLHIFYGLTLTNSRHWLDQRVCFINFAFIRPAFETAICQGFFMLNSFVIYDHETSTTNAQHRSFETCWLSNTATKFKYCCRNNHNKTTKGNVALINRLSDLTDGHKSTTQLNKTNSSNSSNLEEQLTL